jgi:hypothetical protein
MVALGPGALPWRMARDPDKPSLSDRFTRAVIKADSAERPEDPGPQSVEELEEVVARADDKERLIGLIGAPLAGAIGLVVAQSLNAHTAKPTSTTQVLALTLLVLAAAMLASAWFRKRLFLGIAMALYGLSLFNLKFWGFGIPYLLFGSWYLVRAYRFQQKLKLAKSEDTPGAGAGGGPARRAQPNKRYTPPVAGTTKPPKTPKTGTDN